jgi:hypothetical protein
MRLFLAVILLFFIFSCKKYDQPSEPKIQGQWLVTRIDFYRIESNDTINELHFYPGELFILQNEKTPLDTIRVGETFFSCSGAEIFFDPYFGFGGRTYYNKHYFYSITEVNYNYPGFISFDTELRRNVWKIIYTDYLYGMLLQTKGQWDQNSGEFKQLTIGYGAQRAKKYDVIYVKCSRLGP